MTDPKTTLHAIFEAERSLRREERALLRHDPKGLTAELTAAVTEAKALDDRDEARLRLERLADLCAQVPGPAMTDALIAILDDESPSVRVHAAEALADVGFERYAEVARGIERAIEAGKAVHALTELPWVVLELGEPSARKLIARFLSHKEPDVIASAIEALAELGDPASQKDLEPFTKDEREVEVDTEEGDERVTLAELASEAIDALEGNG